MRHTFYIHTYLPSNLSGNPSTVTLFSRFKQDELKKIDTALQKFEDGLPLQIVPAMQLKLVVKNDERVNRRYN